ncbi:tyrosine-type recombinase/integrase [Virgibacillus soli]|uniref:tyrosine-type recombinase/integrase n=1 Tax=Paracerasibacillus soli TaxID=480284 RepID=UPI0035E55335
MTKRLYESCIFEKYQDELGFHISPYTLQHTFAAHLARKGMHLSSIQQLLGYVSLQQSQMYARLTIMRERKLMMNI